MHQERRRVAKICRQYSRPIRFQTSGKPEKTMPYGQEKVKKKTTITVAFAILTRIADSFRNRSTFSQQTVGYW